MKLDPDSYEYARMREKADERWAWTWAGTLIFAFFVILTLVCFHNSQVNYAKRVEGCKSSPDFANCMVIANAS